MFQQRMMLAAELNKLAKRAHPRVTVTPTSIEIDAWCDGDEQEAERVIQMTRKLRTIVGTINGK